MANILIVDDVPEWGEALGDFFGMVGGYTTSTAQDGLEALEALALELPDLILLDLMMPRMDGFKFLEAIREHMTDKPLRVLIVSAVVYDYAREQQLLCWPVVGLLNKPYDYNELLMVTAEALSKDPYNPNLRPRLKHSGTFYIEQMLARQKLRQFEKQLWIDNPTLASAFTYMDNLSGIIHDLINSLGILKENLKQLKDMKHFATAAYCLDILQCLSLLRFKFSFSPTNIDPRTGKTHPLEPLNIKTEFAEVGRRNQVQITGNRLLLDGVLDRKLIRQGIWAALESVESYTSYSTKSQMHIENVSEPGQALGFVFPTELDDNLLEAFLKPAKMLGMYLEQRNKNLVDRPALGLFILNKVLALHGSGQYEMLGQGRLKVTLPVQTHTIGKEKKSLEKDIASLEQDIETLKGSHQEQTGNHTPDISPLVAGYVLTMYDELEAIRKGIAAKAKEPNSKPQYTIIQRSCRLSQLLLRNLLSLTGEFRAPTAKPADAGELLTTTRDMLRNKIGEDVEFVNNIQPDLPLVMADETALQQIFMNLIINADEAIEDEGEITLSANHQNGVVLIEIGDTGCGIEPGITKRIFDLNFSTKGRGSGVGLYVVKNLIEGFGGKIKVESKVGEGTTFSVTLLVADTS